MRARLALSPYADGDTEAQSIKDHTGSMWFTLSSFSLILRNGRTNRICQVQSQMQRWRRRTKGNKSPDKTRQEPCYAGRKGNVWAEQKEKWLGWGRRDDTAHLRGHGGCWDWGAACRFLPVHWMSDNIIFPLHPPTSVGSDRLCKAAGQSPASGVPSQVGLGRRS